MKKYIIALDQGTTSSRAIIFDREQSILGSANRELTQIYPKTGYVEHDPIEIYHSQLEVMNEVIDLNNIDPKEIAAIGITNQRETTIIWNKHTGIPIYNAIVWQCRRTADICENLIKDGFGDLIKRKTGLIVDAYFSGTKIKWILDNVSGARVQAENGDLLFGTVDSFLIWKLTDGTQHITDYTNASRTMLFDIYNTKWDKDLCEMLGVPMGMLPRVCSSSEVYGYADIGGVKVPIASCVGDQQAALFGHTCFEKGDCKNTYGTGCFFLINTGAEPYSKNDGLIVTLAASARGAPLQYVLEGSVFIGGALMQWICEELSLIGSVKEADGIASGVDDNAGVYIVPAFTGLGAPHWNMYARGAIFGLTRGTRKEHIVRAAEEAIAYQSADLIRAVTESTGIQISNLNVDGGASGDEFLMQFQADILNIPIISPIIQETTALGACSLAGLAVGFWKDTHELKRLRRVGKLYSPNMDSNKRKELLNKWSKAVQSCVSYDGKRDS